MVRLHDSLFKPHMCDYIAILERNCEQNGGAAKLPGTYACKLWLYTAARLSYARLLITISHASERDAIVTRSRSSCTCSSLISTELQWLDWRSKLLLSATSQDLCSCDDVHNLLTTPIALPVAGETAVMSQLRALFYWGCWRGLTSNFLKVCELVLCEV